MKKAMMVLTVMAAAAMASSVWAGSGCCGGGAKAAARPAAKAQTECPVMGGKISKSQYADHEGKRVYFCCGQCVDAFQKDPEKYLGKLAEQGVELEKAPEQAE